MNQKEKIFSAINRYTKEYRDLKLPGGFVSSSAADLFHRMETINDFLFCLNWLLIDEDCQTFMDIENSEIERANKRFMNAMQNKQ